MLLISIIVYSFTYKEKLSKTAFIWKFRRFNLKLVGLYSLFWKLRNSTFHCYKVSRFLHFTSEYGQYNYFKRLRLEDKKIETP